MALLSRLLGRDGRGDPGERTARLLAGLDGIESVAPARALEEIAERARAAPGWRAWLDRGEGEVVADFRARRVPEDLAPALGDFFRRFGHRGLSEGDLSTASWEEDPTSVFASLRPLLHRPRGAAFGTRARAEIRRADEEALLARAGLVERIVLRWVITTAQHWVRQLCPMVLWSPGPFSSFRISPSMSATLFVILIVVSMSASTSPES
jgi:hypothetical protein